VLEWLIATLVIINIIFLSLIFFFLKLREPKIDPMLLSLLGGGGDMQKLLMLQMMGGKPDFMKMMLLSMLMKPKRKDFSQELKDEVMGELKPLIKEKLKKEAREEIKKYFKLKE